MKVYNLQLNELHVLTDEISKNFMNGVVLLQGDLAAGKTTFVREMAKKLGVKEDVTSPTFSLQHCYGNRVFHYDIYNHGLEHFISLGMLEELEKEGLHFVEWGDDKLLELLRFAGIETLKIEIKKISDNAREYRIEHA
ncbi:MAG: tRNA (adenosine(37)-N6)-threonylcarbamoyltransferase complex ATPase subunit type 1 TsaE [Campylobacterales bacterium]|nr:tRNA (adenosine(37)-N6)-threonylcarbamoyltransferase complex ATPase subunit type 1 TsaE [Campylobacterales bacterium]